MRVSVDDLANRLRSQGPESLPKLILINGSEPLLLEEALDSARKALQPMGFDERLTYQLETGFDWSNVSGAGQSMSLFSQRRLIELRVPKSLGAPGTKALSEYCATPPGDDLLIVIMPALDYRQRQAKWLKLVENAGWLVDCLDVTPQQFPSWIKQRLQSRALRVEPGVVELLSEQLEGNLLAAAQEIDKLKVLAENDGVTLKLVTASLADQAKFDVYALVDVCLMGDHPRALRIIRRLKTEGIEPVIVVWALVREIRQLAGLSSALEQGQSRSMAFKQFGVWKKRESLVSNSIGRHNRESCYSMLQSAAHLDQTVKGQRYEEVGSVWHQIESLCAQLCAVRAVA